VLAIIATLLTWQDALLPAWSAQGSGAAREPGDRARRHRQYHADAGNWPLTLESLAESATCGRCRPIDHRSADTWQGAAARWRDEVYDIRSGAEGTGLNGQAYADW
jgi:hypothetical protein